MNKALKKALFIHIFSFKITPKESNIASRKD